MDRSCGRARAWWCADGGTAPLSPSAASASDMPAADLAPLGSQQASQHARTGERKLQMQPVEPLHDREVGRRHRARQIINAAAADLQNFRLLGDRQIVLTVDHRFALSNPALVSAPSKKSFSSVSSPILACSDFTSIAGNGVALP